MGMTSKFILYLGLLLLTTTLLLACGNTPSTKTFTETATELAVPIQTQIITPTTTFAITDIPLITEQPGNLSSVSFANNILPIFESRCIQCHGGEQTREGLDLKSYESLMAGSRNGSIVTPGSSADSLLVKVLLENKMPKRGPKLTPDQVQLIADWVNAGATNN